MREGTKERETMQGSVSTRKRKKKKETRTVNLLKYTCCYSSHLFLYLYFRPMKGKKQHHKSRTCPKTTSPQRHRKPGPYHQRRLPLFCPSAKSCMHTTTIPTTSTLPHAPCSPSLSAQPPHTQRTAQTTPLRQSRLASFRRCRFRPPRCRPLLPPPPVAAAAPCHKATPSKATTPSWSRRSGSSKTSARHSASRSARRKKRGADYSIRRKPLQPGSNASRPPWTRRCRPGMFTTGQVSVPSLCGP